MEGREIAFCSFGLPSYQCVDWLSLFLLILSLISQPTFIDFYNWLWKNRYTETVQIWSTSEANDLVDRVKTLVTMSKKWFNNLYTHNRVCVYVCISEQYSFYRFCSYREPWIIQVGIEFNNHVSHVHWVASNSLLYPYVLKGLSLISQSPHTKILTV